MARERRIERARERLRRLTEGTSSTRAGIGRMRARARAARLARRADSPPTWTPEEQAAPSEDQPAAAENEPTAAAPAEPTPSEPTSVPFGGGRTRFGRLRRTRTSPEEVEPAPVEVAPASEALSTGEPTRRADRLRAIPAAVGGGMRALVDGVAGAGRAVGGGVAEAGHRVSDRWHLLPVVARARLLAAAIVAAVVLFVWLVLVPVAPCGFPGGSQCPPEDDAIALVPADALAYAHLDIDPDTDQFAEAQDLAARLPLLTRLAVSALSSVAGKPVDFEADVDPWAGGELAVAIMRGSPAPKRTLMIEVDDEAGARDFAAELLGADSSTKSVEGTKVSFGFNGVATALFRGFLLIGDKGAIDAVVDAPPSEGKLAPEVLDELPDDRLAYAYASGDGTRELLDSGRFSSLRTFVDPQASAGAAASLSLDGDLVDLTVRSSLDAERAKVSPPFFTALPPFDPTLDANVGADSLAYLGLGDPGKSIDSLRGQAARSAPELLSAFNQAEEGLRRGGGISILDDLLPLLGSEAAISVEPVVAKDSDQPETPGVLVSAGTPYVSLIADGVDEEAASTAMADLQSPLIDALDPIGRGQVPAFETSTIDGVEAQSLFVSPQVDLTYAIYDDRLVVATDPQGIAQARADDGGLADSDDYETLTDPLPDEPSLLAYLNLRGLLALGEQVGLGADPTYATFASDLRSLEGIALGVEASDDSIDTDVRLSVGAPVSSSGDAPASDGE